MTTIIYNNGVFVFFDNSSFIFSVLFGESKFLDNFLRSSSATRFLCVSQTIYHAAAFSGLSSTTRFNQWDDMKNAHVRNKTK